MQPCCESSSLARRGVLVDRALGRGLRQFLCCGPKGLVALGGITRRDRLECAFHRAVHVRLDLAIADPSLQILPMPLLRRRMVWNMGHKLSKLATAAPRINRLFLPELPKFGRQSPELKSRVAVL